MNQQRTYNVHDRRMNVEQRTYDVLDRRMNVEQRTYNVHDRRMNVEQRTYNVHDVNVEQRTCTWPANECRTTNIQRTWLANECRTTSIQCNDWRMNVEQRIYDKIDPLHSSTNLPKVNNNHILWNNLVTIHINFVSGYKLIDLLTISGLVLLRIRSGI